MKELSEGTFEMTASDAVLPERRVDAHKGDFGRVLIIGGSVGFTGAPAFAAKAAVRSGAGLVFLGVPEDIYEIEAVKNDEAMVFPLPGTVPGALKELLPRVEKCDAVLIGPGLGLSRWARELVPGVLEAARAPVIVDADGITAISGHIDLPDKLSCPVVLTPHEGEFARLSDALTRLDRVSAAREYAQRHGVTLVLKGHRTVTATPDGRCVVNTTGNPGMATGGSGDVLAGMITAFIAQNIPDPVIKAVYLHGLAGDRCAEEFGQYAMTPTDMTERLKFILR